VLALAVGLLVVALVAAVVRPRGLPEAVVAVPAALVVLAAGAISWAHARSELGRLGPVVGFLAAVLALADACAAEGLFAAAGAALARGARGFGRRMLTGVFVLAAGTTAVLSLDTTVVLLTPVVVAMTRRSGLRPAPHLYACVSLANSASLLLPVSNLTNLLALAVVPVSFARFAALMSLPWLVVVGSSYVVFRWFFRDELARPAQSVVAEDVATPWFAVGVVAATLVGFVVTSFAGVAPVWVAAAGAAVLAGRRLLRRTTTVAAVVRSAAPAFCLFVLALGVLVRAVSDDGLGHVVRHLLPAGHGLAALLGDAAVAAVLANVVNNLPATLLLLPVAATSGLGPVLAVLIGVNVGPNLSYPGSLATLLWRRSLPDVDGVPQVSTFTRLGLATVPVSLVGGTVVLWLALQVQA
jgi:arsenical pump membrane protein